MNKSIWHTDRPSLFYRIREFFNTTGIPNHTRCSGCLGIVDRQECICPRCGKILKIKEVRQ